MARYEQGDVFKKFYRIENQYNQNGSVGLGLAFCKELVNFMDGEIDVTSKLNVGFNVYCYLATRALERAVTARREYSPWRCPHRHL
jgi:K+-sensing histidine kinase KdpD